MDSGSTGSRAAAMYREGEYGMVCADRGRRNIWDSSNNAGFFLILKWQAYVGGGIDKVRHVLNTGGGSGKLADIC